MSGWKNFGKQQVTLTEDSFNDVIDGSAYLELGVHVGVHIEGIEQAETKDGNPFLKLIWANKDGQTARDSVFIYSRPDDKGNVGMHFTYKRLASALISDRALRLKYFGETVMADQKTLAALTGLTATIKIEKGKTGYTIKDVDLIGKVLFDEETQTDIVLKDENDKDVEAYDSYKEAKEMAEAHGLVRCYSNITGITPFKEGIEANDTAIHLVVKTGSATAGSTGSKPGSVGSAPGSSI